MQKRGRPTGTVKIPDQRLLNVWLQVEAFRERVKQETGKHLSVSAACERICNDLGLNWIIGGDHDAIARDAQDSASLLKDIERKRLIKSGGRQEQENSPSKIEVISGRGFRYTQVVKPAKDLPQVGSST